MWAIRRRDSGTGEPVGRISSRRRSTVNGFQRTGTRGTSKKPSGGRGCLARRWRPAGGAPNLRDRERAPAADARRQRLTAHASCGLQGGPISWSAPQSGQTTGARGVPAIRRKTRGNLDLVTDKRITAARARHDASSGSFSKFGRGTSSPPTCRPASAMLAADGWVTAGP